jgi:hypothetical protein
MNDPDDETLRAFGKRFRRIENQIPDPPTQKHQGALTVGSSASRALTQVSLAVGLLVVIFGVMAGADGPGHASPSLPAVVGGSIGHTSTPRLSSGPSSVATASPDVAVSDAIRQRIEVVNGSREVVVSIATDLAAWEWIVPVGARLTLLDEPVARPGAIELIDHSGIGHFCGVLDRAVFDARSFTIVISGPTNDGGYTMTLDYSTSPTGTPDVNYTFDCSG